ncbi:MAG: fumarylacetoacetate hydrolase family protein [Gammaproteobacteria bacterium]|nr:fumarylacetoacetate hydrolase family protein [Gammaproteobacteria bacterium]
MRLVTFEEAGSVRIGVLHPERHQVLDFGALAPGLPRNMLDFIAAGDAALAQARQAVANVDKGLPLNTLRLLAPIPRPAKNLFCVGKNYSEHVKEVQSITASSKDTSAASPESPIIFTKATTSVIGTGANIPASLDPTDSVDYEGELAVVIGRGGRGIAVTDAMNHIYGYTILNDVTSRRLQRRHQQWFLGKSLDGFCPMGPCLLTRDEIDDAGLLRVQTRVNGELRQDDYVREMIFDIPMLIETISRYMTLEPGDIIATGTPAGVGMGFKPPKFLKPGDRVSVTIEPIGTLENGVS